MPTILEILANLPADITAAVPLIQAAIADAENLEQVVSTDYQTLITDFKAFIDGVNAPAASTTPTV